MIGIFYKGNETGYIINGVFRVSGGPQSVSELNRTHTAFSIRIKGSSIFYTDGGQYEANDGAVAYFPSGVDYLRSTFGEEELIVVHLTAFNENETSVRVINGRDCLIPSFEALYNEWCRGDRNKCMALLYKIFGQLEENEREVPRIIKEGAVGIERDFRDASLTVPDLAERCHISEAYFRRLYKAHFGVSPYTALLTRRFEYAEQLLNSGYYEIKEIAEMSGFSDVKYFRAAFKEKYGVTPNEYIDMEEAE